LSVSVGGVCGCAADDGKVEPVVRDPFGFPSEVEDPLAVVDDELCPVAGPSEVPLEDDGTFVVPDGEYRPVTAGPSEVPPEDAELFVPVGELDPGIPVFADPVVDVPAVAVPAVGGTFACPPEGR
jgi:hypothetical protein